MKIVVIGGSGLIGTKLVNRLRESGRYWGYRSPSSSRTGAAARPGIPCRAGDCSGNPLAPLSLAGRAPPRSPRDSGRSARTRRRPAFPQPTQIASISSSGVAPWRSAALVCPRMQ
jgi:hypothetical protein